MGALLGQVGGREIDGDALGRKPQADGRQRGADTLAAFAHRLVGKTHNGEGRHAARDLHLHVDGARIHALKSHRLDMRNHKKPPPALIDRPVRRSTSGYGESFA